MESIAYLVNRLYQMVVITWHDLIYLMEGYPEYDRSC